MNTSRGTSDSFGNDQATFANTTSQSHSCFDQATLSDKEVKDVDGDLDFTLFERSKLNGGNVHELFQLTRTGELSPLALPILHLASNNLLSFSQAKDLVQMILSSSNRGLFNALISARSPATQSIARSLLPSAIRSLNIEFVQSLLDTGIDPNSTMTILHETPLQSAASTGSVEMMRLLLRSGAKPNVPFEWTSSLNIAVNKGDNVIVRLLLEAKAKVDSSSLFDKKTPLLAAVGKNNLEMVRLLLDSGANPNARNIPCIHGTALQVATSLRNIALVRVLLRHGADVDTPNDYGLTALQAAAHMGNLELVELLLEWGASDVLAAVDRASLAGHVGVAKALLRRGAGSDPHKKEACKRMALKAAVRLGNADFVQRVIKSGVDVDAPAIEGDPNWSTSLQEAAGRGDLHLVQLLIESGANVNAPAKEKGGMTALQAAAYKGNAQLVRFLLDAGADVNATAAGSRGTTALRAAARSANGLETVQMLLESGASLIGQWSTVLQTALDAHDEVSLELVQLLLKNRPFSEVTGMDQTSGSVRLMTVDWDESEQADLELISLLQKHNVLDGPYALAGAITAGDFELVKMLLNSGVDVNAKSCTFRDEEAWPLEWACTNYRPEIMQICHASGASNDQISRALQSAVYYEEVKAAEFLISCGADANANPHSVVQTESAIVRTALQAAAEHGNVDLVRLLLAKGAEVEHQSVSGIEQGTALQFAAIAGSIAIVNELVQRGANVNAAPMSKNGRTALEGAAEHGRLDMVQLLLNLEAEIRGSRALHFARKEGHDGVATLLREHGSEDDFSLSE